MLRFDGVHAELGGRTVLRGLDLKVEAGTRLALIGPSGGGKSTLLRVALGLIAPVRGEVTFDGARIVPGDRQHRQRIGTVPQDGGLFPHLTAHANVGLLARHLGWTQPRIDRRVEELTALARLDASMLTRRPHALSGGQRQRVALMRALMLSPRLLLLDEALGALDPVVRAELQAELREIFRQIGATVVIVTHDLAEAEALGDRVAVLVDGRVAGTGTLAALRADGDSVAARFVRGGA